MEKKLGLSIGVVHDRGDLLPNLWCSRSSSITLAISIISIFDQHVSFTTSLGNQPTHFAAVIVPLIT